jgi:hypothetical protein
MNQFIKNVKYTVNSFMWSIILHSVVCLKQVHNIFQSEFSTVCDLVLPLSVSSILSFPQVLPVAAYVVFSSLLVEGKNEIICKDFGHMNCATQQVAAHEGATSALSVNFMRFL